LVVTDRLHGHLLACLARRPNVVLDNVDGKVGAYFDSWSGALGFTKRAADARTAFELTTALLESERR
jgi:pyruvyl transferase EpsO